MATLAALARPYARAAFSQAKQEDSIAAWEQALQFMSLLSQEPSVAEAFGNPRLGTDKVLDTVFAIAESAKLSITGKLRNFITILVQDRITDRAPEIYIQFRKMRFNDANVVPVEVHSAIELSPQQLASLEKLAAVAYSADKVELSGKVSSSLLGGLLLKAEDRVLDLSLREKLRRMELDLT